MYRPPARAQLYQYSSAINNPLWRYRTSHHRREWLTGQLHRKSTYKLFLICPTRAGDYGQGAHPHTVSWTGNASRDTCIYTTHLLYRHPQWHPKYDGVAPVGCHESISRTLAPSSLICGCHTCRVNGLVLLATNPDPNIDAPKWK